MMTDKCVSVCVFQNKKSSLISSEKIILFNKKYRKKLFIY